MAKGKQTSRKVSQAQKLNQEIMQQEIERGLMIISTDESDKLIKGDLEVPPEDYIVLMAAMRSQMGLTFAVLNKLGLPNIQPVQKRFGQHQLIMAQLLHNAYALGIKHSQQAESQDEKQAD